MKTACCRNGSEKRLSFEEGPGCNLCMVVLAGWNPGAREEILTNLVQRMTGCLSAATTH